MQKTSIEQAGRIRYWGLSGELGEWARQGGNSCLSWEAKKKREFLSTTISISKKTWASWARKLANRGHLKSWVYTECNSHVGCWEGTKTQLFSPSSSGSSEWFPGVVYKHGKINQGLVVDWVTKKWHELFLDGNSSILLVGKKNNTDACDFWKLMVLWKALGTVFDDWCQSYLRLMIDDHGTTPWRTVFGSNLSMDEMETTTNCVGSSHLVVMLDGFMAIWPTLATTGLENEEPR